MLVFNLQTNGATEMLDEEKRVIAEGYYATNCVGPSEADRIKHFYSLKFNLSGIPEIEGVSLLSRIEWKIWGTDGSI